MLITPHVMPAQQSTAPPSSLPTTPLAPGENVSGQLPSCDLRRTPEPRRGSNLHLHRLPRNKTLHLHKKPKGAHRPSRRSLRSLLPHHTPNQFSTRERTLELVRHKPSTATRFDMEPSAFAFVASPRRS